MFSISIILNHLLNYLRIHDLKCDLHPHASVHESWHLIEFSDAKNVWIISSTSKSFLKQAYSQVTNQLQRVRFWAMSSVKFLMINYNLALQRYYTFLESQIEYWVFLEEMQHFSYYDDDTYWPFFIEHTLQAMKSYFFHSLNLSQGVKVLNADCEVRHVIIYMTQ